MIHSAQAALFDLFFGDQDHGSCEERSRLSPKAAPMNHDVQESFDLSATESDPEIIEYNSLFDLRENFQRLDSAQEAMQLTVLLILNSEFQGHLPGLIRRQHPALRLLIANPIGHLPGLTSIGDLLLHSASLGWNLIAVSRRISEAIADARRPMTRNERCVILTPSKGETAEIIHLQK